jgi:hypothetical protein
MQGTITTFDEVKLADERDLRRFLQIAPGLIAAAALATGVGVWGVPRLLPSGANSAAQPVAALSAALSPPNHPFGALMPFKAPPTVAPVASTRSLVVASNPFGSLVSDRSFFLSAGPAVVTAAEATSQPTSETAIAPSAAPQVAAIPLPPNRDLDQAADGAPLPPRRPVEFSAVSQPEQPSRAVPPATGPVAPPDDRNIFDKLFGTGRPPAGVAVASQPPQGRSGNPNPGFLAALFGASGPPAGYDKFTAVYDISARVVYMPDGTKLEAHSGLGDRLDDPRYVSERMRGATPPHLYELTPREASFHGVQALRLVPVGGGDLFGRAGLLAHPFMLGPNGDSNGCVSFRDYDAFLRAYQNGQVKRLAVVARAS